MIIRYLLLFVVFFIFSCVNENSNNNEGKQIYENKCVTCHGLKGNAQASGASDLTVSELSKEKLIEVIKNGRNSMRPYKEELSESQIDSVAKYVIELRLKK